MMRNAIKTTFMRPAFLGLFVGAIALPVTVFAQSAFNDPGAAVGNTNVGTLVAVESRIEAGSMESGMNNSVVVQFRNESGADVDFRDVKLFPSSNVTADIVSNECSAEPLLAGAQCAVVMDVKGLQSGIFRVEVLARHTARSRLTTATVTGSVTSSGDRNDRRGTDIEILPSPIDFGRLEASRPIIRSVVIRNMTSSEIEITDVFIDVPENGGFDVKSDCSRLLAGASCVASVVWSPLTRGPISGALVVRHSGSSTVVTSEMKGEFLPIQTEVARLFPEPVPGKGLLVASEEEIDFGVNVQSHSSITVSLVNIGDAAMSLGAVELAGSEQGLKILEHGCVPGLVLHPTEACPLTVSWLPSRTGMVIDDVRVAHTGARGVMVLPVRGTSIAAVNVDQKPIVSVVDDSAPMREVSGSDSYRPAVDANAGPPVLDGYTVSSLARNGAIINGPGGSRMVRNGQTIRLAGHVWKVEITADGVGMSSGRNRVLLVFDRSLSVEGLNEAPVSGTGLVN